MDSILPPVVTGDHIMGSSPVTQMDLFNMPHAARGFLLEKFSTGSKMVDLLLGGFVFIALMQITNRSSQTDFFSLISSAIRWFFDYLFSYRNKGEIEFLIEQVNQVSNCFTPTYRAIMYKLGTIKNDQVWRFKEKRLEWYDNSENKNVKECLYQVLQTEPIQVEDDVWVKCEEKSEDRTNSGGNQVMYVVTYKVCVYSKSKTVHYLKKVVDQWLKEYKDYKKDQLSGKQLIFMVRFPDKDLNNNGGGASEDIQFSTFKTFRSFDNLFFEQKDEVLNDINFFLHEKEWHKKRGLPDSLGILCYGVPGCGKTSFIKALLKKTNRHGVIFSVNRQTKLESIEKLMRSETLCDFPIPQNQRVYILEDIDAMGDLVTKRRNPADEKKADEEELDDEGKKEVITREKEEEIFERQLFKWLKYGISKSSDHHLGFFLNLLDGLVETPGRIIVMTTNHIENLDPALIRPGRIDINIEFVKCTRHICKQIISHFYNKGIDDWELKDDVMDDQISPAELTQICRANKFDFDGAVNDLNEWMIATKKSQLEMSMEEEGTMSMMSNAQSSSTSKSPAAARSSCVTPAAEQVDGAAVEENEVESKNEEPTSSSEEEKEVVEQSAGEALPATTEIKIEEADMTCTSTARGDDTTCSASDETPVQEMTKQIEIEGIPHRQQDVNELVLLKEEDEIKQQLPSSSSSSPTASLIARYSSDVESSSPNTNTSLLATFEDDETDDGATPPSSKHHVA